MLLKRVKHSFAVLPSTFSAIAIQRSLVAIELGNYFIAASIWPYYAFVQPSASIASALGLASGVELAVEFEFSFEAAAGVALAAAAGFFC